MSSPEKMSKMKKFILAQQKLGKSGIRESPFRKNKRQRPNKDNQTKSKFRIKDFKLDNKIHKTIYGATYKEHLHGEDWVVKVSSLKKIKRELQWEDNCPEDPVQECKVMKDVKPRPNLLLIEEELKDKENHYMIMKYMPGGDLMDYIEKVNYLSSRKARRYMKQLLTGLKDLHSQGIAHLDLSPENVLIDKDDNLRICDFGMARRMKRRINTWAYFPPEPEDKPGKDTFRAPEIESNSTFSGEKADLYAAGLILYGMLTGEFPYEEPNKEDGDFLVFWNISIQARLEDQYLSTLVSKQALDLLQRILCPLEDRCTVDEALAHPWINKPDRTSPLKIKRRRRKNRF